MTIIANDFTVTYSGMARAMESLPDNSVRYLLQYGFAQSLQDAKAGSAKEIRETAKLCRAGGDGFDKVLAKWNRLIKAAGYADADFHDDAAVDEIAEAKESADMASRLASIDSGEVGTGVGGVRLDPVDRTMRTIAEREIRAAIDAYNESNPGAKMAAPKGTEWTGMVAEHVAANRDELREKAEAELAATRANAAGAASIIARLVKKV